MDTAPPVLLTRRLVLRPFAPSDATTVQQLAGAKQVYETTQNVPHPYPDGLAEQWIAGHAAQFASGRGITYAITRKENADVIGAIGFRIEPEHRRAELGYWVGVPFWNVGYCTEAVIATVRHGFEALRFHKIVGRHMARNPASGRVMMKAGMRQEGELVDEIFKDGAFHTIVVYGLLETEWTGAH